MIRHYFITNREVVRKGSKDYLPTASGEYIRIDGREVAQRSFRVGSYTFGIKGSETYLFQEPALAQQENVGETVDGLGFGSLFRELSNAMLHETDGKGNLLFYIHGYNVNLNETFEVLERLHEKYIEEGDCGISHIVLFTWPSRENIFRYRDDDQDVKDSGALLAKCLKKLLDYFTFHSSSNCGQKFHLMAHSKGVGIIEHMMEDLLQDVSMVDLPAIFEEIILMAADVDYALFERPYIFHNLTDICERVHVYYHRDDMAPLGSRLSYKPGNKLGRHGMKNAHTSVIPENVFECDVTATKDDKGISPLAGFLNHEYQLTSTPVIEDIQGVLDGKLSRFMRLDCISNGTGEKI